MKLPIQLPPINLSDYHGYTAIHNSLRVQGGAWCPAGYKPIKHAPCPPGAKRSCKTIRDGKNVSCCCPK